MKILIVVLATIAAGFCEIQLVSEWNTYMRRYGKEYKPMENIMRKNNYFRNKERVAAHNFLYEQGVFNYKLALNQFADWTEKEFYNIFQSASMGQFNSTDRWIGASFIKENNMRTARKKRFSKFNSNSVRDQTFLGKSMCNAGWAFSAVAAIEGHDSKYPSGLQQFSEQNLIDCISKELGCGGMTPRNAFEYVLEKGNINSLKKYPYKGSTQDCRYNEDDFGTSGVEIVSISPSNEAEVLDIVKEEGPVVVGFDPLNFSFMFYSSGVYDEKRCKQSINNQLHFMTILGFQDDIEAGKNWVIRNSFGNAWGESGYIRIPRNVNMCGVASQPIYLKI